MRNSTPSASLSAGTGPGGALPSGLGTGRGLLCAAEASAVLAVACWHQTGHCQHPALSPALGSQLMEVLGAMPTWGYINVKAFYISLFYLQIISI